MDKYEIAAEAYKNVHNIELTPNEIKGLIRQIAEEGKIDESAAFVKWLEDSKIKDEFKKLRDEVKVMEQKEAEVKAKANAMKVLEKTQTKLEDIAVE